jgi:hypothetical protein
LTLQKLKKLGVLRDAACGGIPLASSINALCSLSPKPTHGQPLSGHLMQHTLKLEAEYPVEGQAPVSGKWPVVSSEMPLCSYISSILSLFLILPLTSVPLLCANTCLNHIAKIYIDLQTA